MAYAFQIFSFEQVLTSAQMNQVEVNVRDHVHGLNSVVKTGLSWPRSPQSAGFGLGVDDVGGLFELSGSFTITFSAAATLGNGWAVTLYNTDSGAITLDPNGAETIDGSSTFTMKNGDSLVVYSDGANLQVIFLSRFGNIRQDDLSTATQDVSTTLNTLTNLEFSAAGAYGFYPRVRNASNDVQAQIHALGPRAVFSTMIALTDGGSGGTAEARIRYIQSSPPYDLGEGEVHGFPYLLLDAAGNPVAASVAPDPAWSPLIPKDSDRQDDGRIAVKVSRADELRRGIITLAEFVAEPLRMESLIAESDLKTYGMDRQAHPFVGAPADHKAVLVDPMSDAARMLIALTETEDPIADLIYDGTIGVAETLAGRVTPPGVDYVRIG
jgi:hypothetical protein